MTRDISGRGDLAKTLQILWNQAPPQKRGPKAKASVDEIVRAAIDIADQEGLEAVSTRRVAEAVGISPMSFYTHVPGKAELFDLMIDKVLAPLAAPEGWTEMHWRQRLEFVAHSDWRFYLRHPWILELATHRPVLGPNTLAAWELALSAVDGIGLSELEMDRVVSMLAAYVYGAVRDTARQKQIDRITGMTDDQWWLQMEPLLELVDFSAYPVASRVGPVAGENYGLHDPEGVFRFGLQRLLDGLEVYLRSKSASERAASEGLSEDAQKVLSVDSVAQKMPGCG